MKEFLGLLFALAVAGGLGCAGYAWVHLGQAVARQGPLAQEKLVVIEKGSGVNRIAAQLRQEGVIADEWAFRFGAWRGKAGGAMKAGEYAFPAGASVADAISILQKGAVFQRRITIPEGLTSQEIVELLNGAEALEGEIGRIPAEGTLLPETYNYARGEKRNTLLDRMARGMEEALKAGWEKRKEGLPLKTMAEAVILASIVEKETGVAAERARIAGVFFNRLRRGMPLQSDPTTIYALTEGKGRLGRPLTRDDLLVQNPYNTYHAAGLPPGPIANPGRDSIIAVLMPEDNDYIYFVADGTGGHAFARTHEEHSQNVARWRKVQRERK